MSNPLKAAIKYDVVPQLVYDHNDLRETINSFYELIHLSEVEKYTGELLLEMVRVNRIYAKANTPEKRSWIRVETWLEGYIANKNKVR